MSTDIAHTRWQDLKTRGFVHVKGFLSPLDLQFLCDDYAQNRGKDSDNGNYAVGNASWLSVMRLESKIRSTSNAVREATGLNADMSVGALYFAIEKGIKFPWHQDHESYFIFQQHLDYLNFYMPIIKGDSKHSNLCVVPFDRLRSEAPQHYARVEARGAQNFLPGFPTFATNDESGEEYALPVDFEELKEAPELEAGDLLLLRGDMVHRTQDTETDRVALSFRRTRSTAVIDKQRLMSGCARKLEMIAKNKSAYDGVLQCFADLKLDCITARQLQDYVLKKSQREAAPLLSESATAIA